jgi:hypothetical protein
MTSRKTVLDGLPPKHKKEHIPKYLGEKDLPPSLKEATAAFILACAIRHLRGQDREHASMLVHVTRFNVVQSLVHEQVAEHIRHIKQRLLRGIEHEGVLADLHALWARDFMPTTHAIHAADERLAPEDGFTWGDVTTVLAEVVENIEVRTINGTARDALDYARQGGKGLKIIAIGGDKLSRGLTLEGLSISYFLRASKMYDTLMQMGRWFGYRPGYLDLCRLYTTAEMVEWFGHITDAAEELRAEFDMMEASGATPKQYGLKVASHPVLMVTSRVKMRSARSLWLSFSGQLVETVALFRDPETLEANFQAAKRFVASLGNGIPDPRQSRNGTSSAWQGMLWESVAIDPVLEFLATYRTHPDAHKVDSNLLAEFIRSMAKEGQLTNWTIALIGGGEGGSARFDGDLAIQMLRRKYKTLDEGRYSIGRLMSPRDEAIDLDEPAWNAALHLTRETWKADPGRFQEREAPDAPNGPAIRRIRGFGAPGVPARPDRGVLFLYALDPGHAEAGFPPATPPIVAFAISFPGSQLDASVKVEYKVNTVLWEQEYGGTE